MLPRQSAWGRIDRCVEVSFKEPTGGAPRKNRLSGESSPYLLQHAGNPVDWYPWGPEAFAEARSRNKLIFLSIGYSSCHWCHVMERESFEDNDVADILNELFVSVKVDREERPDVDDVYMLATQLMTGNGGWPMSVFITPDGKPLFAGTYFPKAHFVALLTQISGAYANRRAELAAAADRFTEQLKQATLVQMAPGPVPTEQVVREAVATLESRFDAQNGGFSDRPKFPQYNELRLLMEHYSRTKQSSSLHMVTSTLDRIALGGIYDHLAGGFHRYSTDERWLLPHFEKMLYDNAMLARVFAEAHGLTGKDAYPIRARETLDWVLREMREENGMFFCSMDADSEGEEGKYYVWNHQDIVRVLGDEVGKVFCQVYNVLPEGNFTEEATGEKPGTNVLHLADTLPALAEQMRLPDLENLMQEARAKLLQQRLDRPAPATDDKVLTSWNGLMIGSLAYCGAALGAPGYVEAATNAAESVTRLLWGTRMQRRYRAGEVGVPAVLEDYSFLANGLLDLHEATGDSKWMDSARKLVDEMVREFYDPANGGFFTTSHSSETLILRMKDAFDSASPSANGMAAEALIRLHQLTGDAEYQARAVQVFEALSRLIVRSPASASTLVRSIARFHARENRDPEERPVEQGPTVADQGPVTASLAASPVSPDGRGELMVEIVIDPGWHINSHTPLQDYLTPTSVSIAGPGVESDEPSYPAGEIIALGPELQEMSVYQGRTLIRLPFRVSVDRPRGDQAIEVLLSYQACNETTCDAPRRIELRTEVDFA